MSEHTRRDGTGTFRHAGPDPRPTAALHHRPTPRRRHRPRTPPATSCRCGRARAGRRAGRRAGGAPGVHHVGPVSTAPRRGHAPLPEAHPSAVVDRGRQGDRRGRPDRRRRWRRGRRDLQLRSRPVRRTCRPTRNPVRIPPPRGPQSSSIGRAARHSSPTPDQHRSRRRDLPTHAVTAPTRVRPSSRTAPRLDQPDRSETDAAPDGSASAARPRRTRRPPAHHRIGERQQEIDREDTTRPAERRRKTRATKHGRLEEGQSR